MERASYQTDAGRMKKAGNEAVCRQAKAKALTAGRMKKAGNEAVCRQAKAKAPN